MKVAKNGAEKSPSWQRFRPPLSWVFFVAFYLYFALEIEPHLLYHGAGLIDNFPVFYKGWDFFQQFTTYPGGLLEYVSAFLAQLFYYSWLGAAVLTAQAWLICLCTEYALRAVGLPRWRGLRFVGPLLLLAIYSQYTFHLPETMGPLTALVGFCVYVWLSTRNQKHAGVWLVILSIGLYVLAGGPYLLFALLCGLAEVLFRRRLRLGVLSLALAVAIPYVLGVLIFGQRPHDAFYELLPLSWKITSYDSTKIMAQAVWVLLLFLPAALLVGGLGRVLAPSCKPLKLVETMRRTWDKLFGEPGRSRFGLNLRTALLIGVTAAMVLHFRAPRVKTLFEVDYFSCQRMWTQVLEIGRRNPYHYLVCHAVNRALFHTGKLADEMFGYPQRSEALLLTQREALWQKFDTCMDLGLINEAEDALMICLESHGERPLLLDRLARIHLVKGNLGTARVFLGALAKVPFWSRKAHADLARLEADPNLSQDAEIQHCRSVMLRRDFVRPVDPLAALLTENPENRMAYEYGMAGLLLSRRLDQFAQNFERFRPSIAPANSKHYLEALLLHRALNKQPIDGPGPKIPREAKLELHEFFQILQKHRESKAGAREALRGSFSDTYYYYHYFAD